MIVPVPAVLEADGAQDDGHREELRASARLQHRADRHRRCRRRRRRDADALRHWQAHHLRLRHHRARQHEQASEQPRTHCEKLLVAARTPRQQMWHAWLSGGLSHECRTPSTVLPARRRVLPSLAAS
eukprot:3132799-Pleurochrysis_carterae.AAC.4